MADTEKFPQDTRNFYRDVMGLGLKYPMGGQAVFLASGEYHHHLGAHTWLGTDLDKPSAEAPGLSSYIWSASAKDFAWIQEQLEDEGRAYTGDPDHLWFEDNSGITVGVARS